jgi:hypothetical protein
LRARLAQCDSNVERWPNQAIAKFNAAQINYLPVDAPVATQSRRSDFDVFGQANRVFDINAEITHGAFQLAVHPIFDIRLI